MVSESVALSTIMDGLGYAAVGTNNGKTEEDYHYGLAPQDLVALRAIFGRKASLDFTGREYFISDVNNKYRVGHYNIVRADIAFTYQIQDKHEF